MNNLSIIISIILADANTRIGEALISRANSINIMFDAARDSFSYGLYDMGAKCVSRAVTWINELLDYADDIMSSAEAPSWEFVRDALGSIKLEKAPIDEAIRNDLSRRISWFVNPGFGDKPMCIICTYDDGKKTTDEEFHNFRKLLKENRLRSATMHWNGASFDYENGRWVFDCAINPSTRKDLKKYL